ncbi:MAG: hypothetical protein ACRDP9_29620 [Kribbellaceae bacterium]
MVVGVVGEADLLALAAATWSA